MTKRKSYVGDNDGKCELCDRDESRHEPQLAHPVVLGGFGPGGGPATGTMWLCWRCLMKKRADGTIDPVIDTHLREMESK